MCPYKVMIDDNFHYTDESERVEHGVFETEEAAIAICKQIVDDDLKGYCKPRITGAEIYRQYVAFGPDPFVIAVGDSKSSMAFSAWNYARERSEFWASRGQ